MMPFIQDWILIYRNWSLNVLDTLSIVSLSGAIQASQEFFCMLINLSCNTWKLKSTTTVGFQKWHSDIKLQTKGATLLSQASKQQR